MQINWKVKIDEEPTNVIPQGNKIKKIKIHCKKSIRRKEKKQGEN